MFTQEIYCPAQSVGSGKSVLQVRVLEEQNQDPKPRPQNQDCLNESSCEDKGASEGIAAQFSDPKWGTERTAGTWGPQCSVSRVTLRVRSSGERWEELSPSCHQSISSMSFKVIYFYIKWRFWFLISKPKDMKKRLLNTKKWGEAFCGGAHC